MNGGLPNSEIDSLPYCRQNLRFEFRAQLITPGIFDLADSYLQ